MIDAEKIDTFARLMSDKLDDGDINTRKGYIRSIIDDTIVKATGWQPHSVRGFFAGVVRKNLKLDLDSERVDEVRRYRIKSPADGVSKSAKAAERWRLEDNHVAPSMRPPLRSRSRVWVILISRPFASDGKV